MTPEQEALYESIILEPEPRAICFWFYPPWNYGLEEY